MKKLKVRQAFKNKKIVVAVVASTLIATAGVSAVAVNQATGADSEPPIVQEVHQQGEQLENHEARITNAENDISDLQENTNTAPSTNRVEVPVVSSTPSSNPDPEPTPAPVTVVSFQQIGVGGGDYDCKYTYSDGTTHRWLWKDYTEQGSWVTDSNGNNGHWVGTTRTVGNCTANAVGTVKN